MNTFVKNVQNIISPVLSTFGIESFQIDPEGDKVTFFNDKVAVVLIKDCRDQDIIVVFKELKKRTLDEVANGDEKVEIGRTIGLGYLLEIKNREIIKDLCPKSYPLSIEEEKRILRLISDCFKDYCADILNGDFSIWSLTSKEEDKRMKEWIEKMPEQLREKWKAIYKLNDSTIREDEE